MTVQELRRKYLDFFVSKGHSEHASGSLIPYDVTGRLDESLLFNGAGMVQFKPYFRGVAEPSNKRLTTSQKCLRTGDIESVGNPNHLTFFEMLGNFSFGDYFKAEAIAYSWEFLTSPEWLGLDPKRLSFTVFSEDDEAYAEWAKHLESVGIDPSTRVFRLGEETNYWPAGAFSNGPPGPCGPNTEMFYWTSNSEPPPSGPYTAADYLRDDAAGKWLEIWNDVFIQYEWQGKLRDPNRPDKGFEKTGMPGLPFQSVDTGMGIERTVTVLNGFTSVYQTDAFQPIFRGLEALKPGLNVDADEKVIVAARIIADHLRASVFCIADGVLPSNTGRGYVLRRLIRRAVLKGARSLGFDDMFLAKAAESVISTFGDHYHELIDQRDVIIETLKNEESQFRRTLDNGERMLHAAFDSLLSTWKSAYHQMSSESRDVLGLPSDITRHLNATWEVSTVKFVDSVPIDSIVRANLTEIYNGLEDALVSKSSESGFGGPPISPQEAHGPLQILKQNRPQIGGELAFQLYDTFGFPLEVTQEICAEAGVPVDVEGFREAMAQAQERSRQASGMETVYGGVAIIGFFQSEEGRATPTEFLGYTATTCESTIVGAVPMMEDGVATEEFVLALDRTPFYAESGGQVSDHGLIVGDGFELEVTEVTKQNGVYVHLVCPKGDLGAYVGLSEDDARNNLNKRLFQQVVKCQVDENRRTEVTRNHTATHLLHAALRQVLGSHVTQAGSLVTTDHLRFDFTHGQAMTPQQIAEVEQLVYNNILAAQEMTTYDGVPLDQARAMGAMALFGEKYADRVRVVQVGDMTPDHPSFSRELCGGIHVKNTGEIGLFKILHESSAASGVRRIVAATGVHAYQWVHDQQQLLESAAAKLKSTPKDLLHAIDKTLESLREERKKREKLAQQGAGGSQAEEISIGPVVLKIQQLRDADPADAKAVSDRLVDGSANVVALISNLSDGKVSFVCKVGDAALKSGAKAGDILREVAKATGGGGGGRPDFATAGGRDASKLTEAIEAGKAVLATQVGHS
ncbi:alanine--tRNA ligase [Kamptonema cortianum]|nr:alanine--tRNA ligase [Geitlerinema splendidum]MDK3156944.1 alanine--tRNA ligase [Kamptonema cortianum]